MHGKQLLGIVIVLALLAGCSPAPAPSLTQAPGLTNTATLPPPTETALPPTATQAPLTETPLPPTETPTPQPSPTAVPTTVAPVSGTPSSGTAVSTSQATPTVNRKTATAVGTADSAAGMTPTLVGTSATTQSASAPAAPGTPKPTLIPAPSGNMVSIYYLLVKSGPRAKTKGGMEKDARSPGCGDSVVPVGSGVPITGDIAKDVAGALRKLFASKWDYSGNLYNPLYRSTLNVQEVQYDDNGLISIWLTGNYKPTSNACDNTAVKAQIWNTIRQFHGVKRTNIFLNRVPFGDRLSNDK